MKRDVCIPVSSAQALAESLDLRQVVIVAWDGDKTHVVTYGGSAADSDNAAKAGNQVKKMLGWPENLQSESPKVLQLQERVAELEKRLADLNSLREFKVHVVEGTEYERGWGSRPDGYVAFLSREAADGFVASQHLALDFESRMKSSVPDEYTAYQHLGERKCSEGFFKVVQKRGTKHFTKLSELLE